MLRCIVTKDNQGTSVRKMIYVITQASGKSEGLEEKNDG